MKKLTTVAGITLLATLAITGCSDNENSQRNPPAPSETSQTENTNDSSRSEWKPCGADTTGDIEVGQGLCDHHGN